MADRVAATPAAADALRLLRWWVDGWQGKRIGIDRNELAERTRRFLAQQRSKPTGLDVKRLRAELRLVLSGTAAGALPPMTEGELMAFNAALDFARVQMDGVIARLSEPQP